jgi:hypothetical protein
VGLALHTFGIKIPVVDALEKMMQINQMSAKAVLWLIARF